MSASRSTDWYCPICDFSVYGSKSKCSKCAYRRGDWFCRGCRIGNDPSLTHCERCKQSKENATTHNNMAALSSTPWYMKDDRDTGPIVLTGTAQDSQVLLNVIRKLEKRLHKVERGHRDLERDVHPHY